MTKVLAAPLFARVPDEYRGHPDIFVSYAWSNPLVGNAFCGTRSAGQPLRRQGVNSRGTSVICATVHRGTYPQRGGRVSIARFDIQEGSAGRPIISRAVVRGDTVYLCGVLPDPVADIKTQTKQVLDRIDQLLKTAGTDKSKLLTAQVWLSDMRFFEDHNAVWNEWVDRANPPARACVRADLVRTCLVEIMVTAAK
jgi:enamine deaminase RidA (YjgF/YER057c/UK114 family)